MTNKEKATSIAKTIVGKSACTNSEYDIFQGAMEMANWKDEQFWSYQNIEQIIKTYKSFPNRSCPSELVKNTIEKLKPTTKNEHKTL